METERIYIGSDHAGLNLKKAVSLFLEKEGYNIKDLGPFKLDPKDDYPDYARKVCRETISKKGRGILICGSGQGMDRAANKIPGIRASVCWDEKSAVSAKKDGNINVLCLGERMVSPAIARKIVKIWLEVPFGNEERHLRRIMKSERINRK